MHVQTNIEKTLDLEEIDGPLLYRSKQLWLPIGARGVFGGQVIGLALNAAMKTVDESFQVHSLHCYFLLPGMHRVRVRVRAINHHDRDSDLTFVGDSSIQIVYKVDHIRTGKTYATRFVTATQRGRKIFAMVKEFLDSG